MKLVDRDDPSTSQVLKRRFNKLRRKILEMEEEVEVERSALQLERDADFVTKVVDDLCGEFGRSDANRCK